MVKYCLKKYPNGSFKGQKSDGRYMDGWLYKNLELLADKISKDMTFLGIIYSSTLEVGTGKSVMGTQIGEAWTEMINKKYKLNIPYDVENIVWKPKDLIDKAFKVPKYSYVLVDEWEDSTYWSELGMSLRQFFRKCRQLNLFIMCIIPNWFQLPISYAVSRSVFAIDVRFDDKLNRGNFAFYNFPAKRILYIGGKRQHNYYVCKPTFLGKFTDGYGVDEEEYRKRKYEDMVKYDQENPVKKTKAQIELEIKIEIFKNFMKKNPNLSNPKFAEWFGVGVETIRRWKKGAYEVTASPQLNYNKYLSINKEIIVNEEELEQREKNRGQYVEQEPEEIEVPI